MVEVGSRVWGFLHNRWLVFVAAMWMQSCAGVGYLFGSLSPVIKASLGYNQRQVAGLGVAKDLGDSVGFLAGTLCAVLPLWAALLVGAAQNLVGYGWVWLAVTRRVPVPPLWAVRSPRHASSFSHHCITFFPFTASLLLHVRCSCPRYVPFFFLGFSPLPCGLRLHCLVACRDRLCSLYQRLSFLTFSFVGEFSLHFLSRLMIESCTLLLWNMICWNFWFPNAIVVEIPSFRFRIVAVSYRDVRCRHTVLQIFYVKRKVLQIFLRLNFLRSRSFPCQIFFFFATPVSNIPAHMVSKHGVTSLQIISNHTKDCIYPRASGMQSTTWAPSLRKGQLS